MTNRLLGADGISAVLEVGGGNVLIVDGAASSLTGDILLVDGVSSLLLRDGTSHALLSGGAAAATGGNCRILKADGVSDLLLANGSDHLLLFDCVPTAPGDGCRILKADGTSALLLANGVDHLLLFDCVPAVVATPLPDSFARGGGASKKQFKKYQQAEDKFQRRKREAEEALNATLEGRPKASLKNTAELGGPKVIEIDDDDDDMDIMMWAAQ